MSTLTTSIQHHTGNPIQCNKARKKRRRSWKRTETVPVCVQLEKVYRVGQRWQAGLALKEVFKLEHRGRGGLCVGQSQACLVDDLHKAAMGLLHLVGGGGKSEDKVLGSLRSLGPVVAGADDNHTLLTPGGLCVVAENGDVAPLVEVNRHGPARSFNGRLQ